MPKSKDRDFFVNARRVVEQAIGEQMDGKPLEKDPPKEAGLTDHIWSLEELVGLLSA